MDAAFALNCTDEQFERYAAACMDSRQSQNEQIMMAFKLQMYREEVELKAQQQPSRLWRLFKENA